MVSALKLLTIAIGRKLYIVGQAFQVVYLPGNGNVRGTSDKYLASLHDSTNVERLIYNLVNHSQWRLL